MDEDVKTRANYKNSYFGKAVDFTKDIIILSTISPVFAATYAGAIFGAGFKKYNLEKHNDEREQDLTSDNETNQGKSYSEKNMIKRWRDSNRFNGFLVGGGSMVGLGVGAFLNIELYRFIEKPQNSGIDYFFSPVASSLIDLLF
ncbi:MAG TPA: hypothetical protein ENI61_03030 [Ignavibacteria bacterium]|nr:hypothetical protein [Ignavibacteria bacterium]